MRIPIITGRKKKRLAIYVQKFNIEPFNNDRTKALQNRLREKIVANPITETDTTEEA